MRCRAILASAIPRRYRSAVLLPLLLIIGASVAAAIVTYGTDAGLARFAHGVQAIMWSRRLEWPLIILCLLLCGGLLALIISGKRRAWWLVGLGVVLALFVRGFSTTYRPTIRLTETVPFVGSEQSNGLVSANEFVVGFLFAGKYYALPYHQLTAFPLLLISDFDQRALVIWSVTANAATVLPLDRDAYPHDLEVVSTPADSLLLFDRRLGQFIVGVTGRAVDGSRLIGFGEPIPSVKVPYDRWLAVHPKTRLMGIAVTTGAPITPAKPLLRFATDANGSRSMNLLCTTQPIAWPSEETVSGMKNIRAGRTSVLLVREPNQVVVRAYDRESKDDLFLTFAPQKKPDRKHPTGVLVDAESNSLWTTDGRAIDGPLKGTQLKEIEVREGMCWGVMKYWMPGLQWIDLK